MRGSDEQMKSISQRLLRGGLWVFAARAAGMIVVFAIFVALAKLLAPGDFAAFVLASSVVNFAAVAAGFGMPTLACRYLAESLGVGDRPRGARAMRATFLLGGLASLLVGWAVWRFADLWAVHWLRTPELAQNAGTLGLWVVLLAMMMLVAETFRGLHLIHLASVFGGASGGLVANCLLLTLLAGTAFWGALNFRDVTLLAVASFVPAMIVALALLGKASAANWRKVSENHSEEIILSRLSTSVIIADAAPLCLLHLLSMGLDQCDIWMVGAWMSDENVATYGAARRLAFLGLMPLTQVGWAIVATIAELNSKRQFHQLEQVLRNGATFSFWAAAVLVLPMIVFARPLMGILFGEAFVGGASILAILGLSQLIGSWFGPTHQTLLMTGNQRLALFCHLAPTPVLLFARLVADRFGLFGFTCLIISMLSTSNVLLWIAVRYRLGIWSHARLSPSHVWGLAQRLLRRDAELPAVEDSVRHAN